MVMFSPSLYIKHIIFLLCSFPARMSCNSSVTHVQLSTLGKAERTTVHLMPCEIEHNGPAQVSQYFSATTKDRKQGGVLYLK